MYENGGFAHFLANYSPKTLFFAQKYLTRYTHETFFEEYTNFEAHYLSHCRVIPLQSLGSHICPQLHGLGLSWHLIGWVLALSYGASAIDPHVRQEKKGNQRIGEYRHCKYGRLQIDIIRIILTLNWAAL